MSLPNFLHSSPSRRPTRRMHSQSPSLTSFFLTFNILSLSLLLFSSAFIECQTCTKMYFSQQEVPIGQGGECVVGTLQNTQDRKCYSINDAIKRKEYKECYRKSDCSLGTGFGSDLLECIDGSCLIPLNIGDKCDKDVQCITQKCRNKVCDYAQAGDKCQTTFSGTTYPTSCAPGHRCNSDERCVRLSQERETCTSSADCVTGLYCDRSVAGMEVCLPPLQPGEQCQPNSAPCTADHFCRKDPAKSVSADVYTCSKKRPVKAFCESDNWCLSTKDHATQCRNNRCEPIIYFANLAPGSPCVHTRECAEGVSCIKGICTVSREALCTTRSDCQTNSDTSNQCYCTPHFKDSLVHRNGTCSYNCEYARQQYAECFQSVYQEDHISWTASYYGSFNSRCCSQLKRYMNCESGWILDYFSDAQIPGVPECNARFNAGAVVGIVLASIGGTTLCCLCLAVTVIICIVLVGGGVILGKKRSNKNGAEWIHVTEDHDESTRYIPPSSAPQVSTTQQPGENSNLLS